MINTFIVDIQSILRLWFTVHNIDIKNTNEKFQFTYSVMCFKASSMMATDLFWCCIWFKETLTIVSTSCYMTWLNVIISNCILRFFKSLGQGLLNVVWIIWVSGYVGGSLTTVFTNIDRCKGSALYTTDYMTWTIPVQFIHTFLSIL